MLVFDQLWVVQESIRVERVGVGAPDRGVEVELAVGHHDVCARDEVVATDDGVFYHAAEGGGAAVNAEGFEPKSVEDRAVLEKDGDVRLRVEAVGEGFGGFGPDIFEQVGDVEGVGQ